MQHSPLLLQRVRVMLMFERQKMSRGRSKHVVPATVVALANMSCRRISRRQDRELLAGERRNRIFRITKVSRIILPRSRRRVNRRGGRGNYLAATRSRTHFSSSFFQTGDYPRHTPFLISHSIVWARAIVISSFTRCFVSASRSRSVLIKAYRRG